METSSEERLKKSSEADDRISNLPDDVLFHILSFVPTFNSVATCMLSSRRKHLWKHVPILNFDDTLPPFNSRENDNNVRFANFVNRVWTLHVPKVLDKFSLRCKNDYIYDVGKWVSDSITRNIHSLDLTLHSLTSSHVVQLPSDLFTCKTLEVLALKSFCRSIIVNLPAIVCLPKLKTMELVGLKYKDDRQGNLISSCVSLESLVVNDIGIRNDTIGFHTISSSTLRDVEFRLYMSPCLIGYNPQIFCSSLRRLNLNIMFNFKEAIRVPSNIFTCKTLEQLTLKGRLVICVSETICLPSLTFLALLHVEFEDEIFSRLISSSTSLQSLVVHSTTKGKQNSELYISSCTLKVIEVQLNRELNPGLELVINASALKCLNLKTVGYVDYQIEDLASLEQADVRISCYWPISYDYCSSVLTKAYQALQHVKHLTIYQGDSNAGVVEHVLPMFNRLTDLDITINGSMGYGFFKALIKNSIKLENLAFVLDFEALHDQYLMNDLNTVPACLLSSLRCVSIRCFAGREYELAVALYLLENSRMMEKMEVCFSRYHNIPEERRIELRNEILNVPRGSETCDVVILG